jgi:endonuclease/exonuclease/phosphatase family metal-dependent hydrolase
MAWHGVPATGYTVTQSTSPDMSQDVTTYTTTGPEAQFTPYGLNPGATYYFTVASNNGGTKSPPSPVVSGVNQVQQLPVRMMTYNVLRSDGDGRLENGNIVAPWSQRAAGVVARIQAADPDVVAIEEGGGWVGAVRGARQADDLVSRLGGEYALANTEIPPSQPHYFRTGVYLLYKTAEFTPLGTAGHWALGDTRWAAYQELQSRSTGARFVAVAAHLLVGPGGTNDQLRAAETTSLLQQSRAYAANLGGIPIIYGGDWNSDATRHHATDAVRDVMRASGVDDALNVAQSRTNAQFNSANGYLRTPPAGGDDIDAIFAPAGVGVSSWGMELLLNNGKFSGVIPSDHNAVWADLLVPYS